MLRRPSVRPPFSNIFSEIAWPIKAKFYVEPPSEGGTKVYKSGPGHMTKMAAMPIYGKKPLGCIALLGFPYIDDNVNILLPNSKTIHTKFTKPVSF